MQNKQKQIETYNESQILSADKPCEGDEIFEFKQNFLSEVVQRKKLESDIAILVTGRKQRLKN